MKLNRLALIAALAFGCVAGEISTAYAQSGEIVIRTAPPRLRAETRGSYRSGYEWVPGYWRWDGRRHVWVAGHYERSRRGYVWQAPRWDRRYDGWVFIPGRWVRAGGTVRPQPLPPPDRRPPPYTRPDWRRQGWRVLGEETVGGERRGRPGYRRGGRADRDTIHVGRDRGNFHKLMITVEDSDIELHDIVITFANGRTYAPKVRHYYRENQRSRVIDLPNGPRYIEHVQFLYSNLPGGGRARVQLWAR